MPELRESRSERYFRFSQRSVLVLLCLVLTLGALGLALALRPDVGARWMMQAAWTLPLAITIAAGALQRTLGPGKRWRSDTPEARAVRDDEWRRASLDRALRVAFLVVLVAQVPLGLALSHLPTLRALMAMVVATSVLGLATLLTLFLIFSRAAGAEASDER